MGRRRRWTAADIPDQSGRVAVVTGANTGIGFATARMLAARGAVIVLACRDSDRARRAAEQIRRAVADADVRTVRLDLARQSSVRDAAAELRATTDRLDLLVNNAGIMDAPDLRTEDGFELTFAVNHLGPFALTGRLLDRLLATPGSRVVNVSSLAHRRGAMDLDAISTTRGHDPSAAYARSKLANLLFTYELQRRLRAAGADSMAVAAHPGLARTELNRNSPRSERVLLSRRLRPLLFWLAHDARSGALPTLRAAVDPGADGGCYLGPTGWFGHTGDPDRVESSAHSHDRTAQRRLWETSERLTGVWYPIPASTS
jgi:NAD(P)-dependent dehydrogenase (short-subunit alcohol dehydrogenase family)